MNYALLLFWNTSKINYIPQELTQKELEVGWFVFFCIPALNQTVFKTTRSHLPVFQRQYWDYFCVCVGWLQCKASIVPLGSTTPVISPFPRKRQCQQADALFTQTHNEGQCEAVALWSRSREAIVCPRHVTYAQEKHTATTCNAQTYTGRHPNTWRQCVRKHACMQTNTCSQWHKASSAQLRLSLWNVYGHPGRRGRFPASLMGTTFDLSVCLSHFLSLSLFRPFPERPLAPPQSLHGYM